jgi:hypothetical protein
MWRRWILVACCVALAAGPGCKGKGDANSAPDPAALKAQQELIARRDALLAQRQKLAGERDKLSEEIKQVEATGGDTTELAKKRADLEQQLQGQDAELDAIRTNVEVTLAKIAAAGDAAAGLASREANMGTREASLGTREDRVGRREAQMAERERVLAQRETQLAQREKETCGAAAPVIVQQVAAPKGGNYTRKEIEPLLSRARATMNKKGILSGDLGPAGSLETDATKAMADGDWGKAYLAAAQLAATVDQIKIDRNFVSAKHGRLHARVKSSKLDETTSQALTEGMKEVLQKYGDGDFAAANRKLNQLWALGGFR